jgi:hypothetical protein
VSSSLDLLLTVIGSSALKHKFSNISFRISGEILPDLLHALRGSHVQSDAIFRLSYANLLD